MEDKTEKNVDWANEQLLKYGCNCTKQLCDHTVPQYDVFFRTIRHTSYMHGVVSSLC